MTEEFVLHPQLAADSHAISQWTLSELRLINNRQVPWFILVPRRAQISELFQLPKSDKVQLWRESDYLSQSIFERFSADKLNVAAIGNIVPQLHLHHVVRFHHDPCWPNPVWGNLEPAGWSDNEVEEIRRWARQTMTLFQR